MRDETRRHDDDDNDNDLTLTQEISAIEQHQFSPIYPYIYNFVAIAIATTVDIFCEVRIHLAWNATL